MADNSEYLKRWGNTLEKIRLKEKALVLITRAKKARFMNKVTSAHCGVHLCWLGGNSTL